VLNKICVNLNDNVKNILLYVYMCYVYSSIIASNLETSHYKCKCQSAAGIYHDLCTSHIDPHNIREQVLNGVLNYYY